MRSSFHEFRNSLKVNLIKDQKCYQYLALSTQSLGLQCQHSHKPSERNKMKRCLPVTILQQVAVWSSRWGTDWTCSDASNAKVVFELFSFFFFFNGDQHQPDQQCQTNVSVPWCEAVSVGNGEGEILTSDTVARLQVVWVNRTLSYLFG